MVAEMQKMFVEQVRTRAGHEARPRQLAELDARIERLRERQRCGDPDLTADELEGAVARALKKRKQLESALPRGKTDGSRSLRATRAAELYRQQLALGLGRRSASRSQGSCDPAEPVQWQDRAAARPLATVARRSIQLSGTSRC